MKRKGSITVLSLIMMAVILISALYLIYLTKLQSLVSSSYNHKIQSNYMAESKLNMLLYNDKYYKEQLLPVIEEYVRKPVSNETKTAKITINESDLDESDINNIIDIELFFNSESKHIMGISSKSSYNGIENEIKAYMTLVNDLFHNGDGKIINELNVDNIEQIIDDIGNKISINHIPSNINSIYTFNKDNIAISYRGVQRANIQLDDQNIININTSNGLFFVIKNQLFTPIVLEVKETEQNMPVAIKGLIYLEGDLLISSEFQFNGILILNGGKIIVNTDKKPLFKGIILTDGEEDYTGLIDIQSNYQQVCQYGVYLPGFIEPKIEVIKKY